MIVKKTLRTGYALSIFGLSLLALAAGGCTVEGRRVAPQGEPPPEAPQNDGNNGETLAGIGHQLAVQVGSAGVGSLHQWTLPQNASIVGLSDLAAERASALVPSATPNPSYEQNRDDLHLFIDALDSYSRPDCEGPEADQQDGCDAASLEEKWHLAVGLHDTSLELYERFRNPQPAGVDGLLYAQHAQLLGAARLALLDEMHALDQLRGMEQGVVNASQTLLCDEAERYHQDLEHLQTTYDNFVAGLFTQPYLVTLPADYCNDLPEPCPPGVGYKGCYGGPDGAECGPEIGVLNQGQWANLTDQDLLAQATTLRDKAHAAVHSDGRTLVLSPTFDENLRRFARIGACEVSLRREQLQANSDQPSRCIRAGAESLSLLDNVNSTGSTHYQLTWQSEGQLVMNEVTNGTPSTVWTAMPSANPYASLCWGHGGELSIVQDDVLLWVASTDGAGQTLNLSRRGLLTIQDDNDTILWHP